jgi:hypothetical protein
MTASPRVSGVVANSEPVLAPEFAVRKPNSILSCRCTGTLVTLSANGTFRCGPGSVVRT